MTSILPPSLPKITRDQVEAILAKYPHEGSVAIVGIRGYYEDTMGKPGQNDRGIYDDAIILIGPNYFKAFNGNTDPSKYKALIGTLAPGLHYYKKGKHGISRPKPYVPYDAFRPATPDETLPGTRDGQNGTVKIVCPNIHKGGYNSTSSEACQTIPPDQWLEFQTNAYRLMDEYNQKKIAYILVEQL